MPTGYATAFEGLMYGLLLVAARHAWRTRGGPGVLSLTMGVIYGVLLEAATIQQLDAYHYGRFWVMVTPEVPLAIGVGWGVIVYGVGLYTRALALPVWQRAVLNGLLALNIDLAMDAVAIRLGFWDWGFGYDFQYFGVPWANFWAWFWVVSSFTGVGDKIFGPGWRAWLAPFVALAVGLMTVLATNALLVFVLHPWGMDNAAIALLLGTALLVAGFSGFWKRWQARPAPLAGWVARAFHGYFLIAGLVSGVLWQSPVLLAVAVAMLALAEVVYVLVPARYAPAIRAPAKDASALPGRSHQRPKSA